MSTAELVIVRLTAPWALQTGGSFNVGERVAFAPHVAKEIVEKGCGVVVELPAKEEPSKTKEVASPPQDKMVKSGTRKRLTS